MSSPKQTYNPDDKARMTLARQSLEDLLRDAGPGITVTPTGQHNHAQVETRQQPAQPTANPTPQVRQTAPPPGQRQARQSSPANVAKPARPAQSAPRTAQPQQSPAPAQVSTPSRARARNAPTTAPTRTPAPRPTQAAQPPHPAQQQPAQQTRPAAQDATTRQPQTPQRQATIRQQSAHPPHTAPTARQSHPGATPARPQPAPARAPAAAPAPTPTPAPPQPRKQAPAPSIPSAPQATVTGNQGELASALKLSKRAFMAAGLFSFVINLLMLAGPLFMLQVYDRVLTSGSLPTLIALSLMTAVAYLIIGVLELVRSRVIVRMGLEVDGRISSRIFNASLRHSVQGSGQSNHALRELDQIRQFIASPGPMVFFDAPWTPIYLLVIFMAHWILGVAATIGALALLAIAWISDKGSRDPQLEAGVANARALELAETGQRNAQALTAMGMVGAYRARWEHANSQTLAWQLKASDHLGGMTALSKTAKLLFQSMMLAIGAALALNGLISAGAIVAGTIIFGRALAPVDQAIGHWRQFLKAKTSYAKLETLLSSQPPIPPKTALPPPQGYLGVSNLKVAAPQEKKLILANINFQVQPGQVLAVIGPSASGKSTLVRTLVGIWKPSAGLITLDNARLDQWNSEDLGRHIGYLPQSVELFSGSVTENIARFDPNARDEDIVEAAKQAHAHDLILALPDGYDTQLGPFATHLSGGQQQRLALARALYKNPALVILDEPNANLDRNGDVALANAIDGMRERNQTVVLVSHRVQAIGKADLLLYLDKGLQRAFGPREDVMNMLQGANSDPQTSTSSAPETAPSPAPNREADL